ncbi:MFS general substrate transporter [Hyaloscypha variabilis F]|uniref:MFS general substrate transporter n=1 Tax=Hyaloscypha variabilis (strain UAMH 11265 / GT02V1 / F) TaxID=1149755 RepID=A0A2J6R1C0_HYAVF|nr:MFS general substrate transporter [Hyaloscypha variabilis F]
MDLSPAIEGKDSYPDATGEQLPEATVQKITRISGTLSVLVAGIALFSDGYNAQIIGYMEPLFSDLYPHGISKSIKTRLSNSYLIGEIFGMLFFGVIIDKLGRRTGIVFATFFLILGIVLATAAHGKDQLGLFWMMIVARGIAGFGAGGEYPVCGTNAAEASDESLAVRRKRGILVALATDFAIDLGFVVAGVVALIVLACYDNKTSAGVWRICFGLGIVLPLSVFFFRIRMVDSTQYRKHAIKTKVPYIHALRLYWKPMLGTSLAWFCYDFVTYPFGIFSSTIISQLNPNNTLTQNIGYGTVVNCFYLPGCIVGGLLMDKIGRKQTMTLGFFLWGILGFILCGALGPIQTKFPLFVVLYGIFNSLGEMGPGVATFLCAAESFPTPLRGHYMGFAAAVGKAGAAIGTQVFTPIQDSFSDTQKGQQGVFLIGSAFAIVGGLIAWFFIPDKERDLESEDARFRAYLEEKGFDTSFYGESLAEQTKTTGFKL